MTDTVLQRFLESQLIEGERLTADSDILSLIPTGGEPSAPTSYAAQFRCAGLVRRAEGSIVEFPRFRALIQFSPDYLRSFEPMQTTMCLDPGEIWHPNVMFPFVCLGHIRPCASIVEIVYQLWEIWTWRKANLADPLNPAVSEWARSHWDGRPIDVRPLKRRRREIVLQRTDDADRTRERA